MTADNLRLLLAEAKKRNVTLWVTNGKVACRAPRGVLTEEFKGRIRSAAADVIAYLNGPTYTVRGPVATTAVDPAKAAEWQAAMTGELAVHYTNGTHVALHLARPVEIERLRKAADILIARYPILGARLRAGRSGPEFAFEPSLPACLEVEDVSVLDQGSRGKATEEALTRMVWRPFACNNETLFRVFVVNISQVEHIVGFVAHHLICDMWAMSILLRELASEYMPDAVHYERSSQAPSLQYSDYAASMADWLQGPAQQARLDYWRNQLRNAPATRIEPDYHPDARAAAPLAITPVVFSATVCAGVERAVRERGTTMFFALLAAKCLALSTLSGSRDVVVMVVHARRQHDMLTGLIASTADQLAIRVRLSGKMTFYELLVLVQETLEGAISHEIPFGVLSRHFAAFGTPGIFPFFNFIDGPRSPLATAEISKVGARVNVAPPPQPMRTAAEMASHAINVVADGTGIFGQITYSPLLYARQTMERFAEIWARALQCFGKEPSLALDDVLQLALCSE